MVGSTGFVGRHVAERLRDEGEPFRGLARRPSSPDEVAADLIRPETLGPALQGATVAIICAAITADRKEVFRGQYRQVNAEGTRNLVAAAKDAGVRRLVLLNGLGTQPGREGSYMRTRWEMLEAVRESGVGWVSLQPSIMFGPGATFPRAIAGLARLLPVVPVLGGGLCVQPISVDDVVTCLVSAAREDRWDGRAIDLGGPEQMTMREFSRRILVAAGRRRPLVPLPPILARIPARLVTVLPNPPFTPATLELFDFDNCTAPNVVQSEFGFQPASFLAGR